MMELRSLDNTFCDRIIDLILPIQQHEFNVPVTAADQPDLLDIERFYHGTGGGFWGAVGGGSPSAAGDTASATSMDAAGGHRLLGTIGLIAIGHHAGVIRKMFVRKEYRGKEHGIGQHLLDHLIAYCSEKSISDLYLGTHDRLQAALRFYERNGFQKIAPEVLPADFPRMAVDNIFYHLHLDI